MKIFIKTFHFFSLFFSILNAQLMLPDQNIENWKILHDDKTWIGWKNDGKIDWCRTKSVLNAPIIKVQKIIEDKVNYPQIFKRIETSKLITEEIVYISLDMPFPFSGRDYVVKYIQIKEDLDFTYRFFSVVNDDAPLNDDYVRLVRAAGEWRLKPLDSKHTEITYTWNGELLGDFPNWALTRAWKQQGLEVINWLEEALLK